MLWVTPFRLFQIHRSYFFCLRSRRKNRGSINELFWPKLQQKLLRVFFFWSTIFYSLVCITMAYRGIFFCSQSPIVFSITFLFNISSWYHKIIKILWKFDSSLSGLPISLKFVYILKISIESITQTKKNLQSGPEVN